MSNDPSDAHAYAQEGPRRRRGLMLVLSSPSGAGKTTLTRILTRDDAEMELSVSWTTRPPREGEVDGVHYHFVDKEKFRTQRAREGFLEWAEVHDNFYGSPRLPVMSALERGRDVLFDIDWQGAQQLTNTAEADVVKVFILPPSMKELRQRLNLRAKDSQEVIKRRMSNAYSEISRWDGYDYVLVNEDLEQCERRLKAIIAAERLRRTRQPWLPGFVQHLLQEDT
jgi:guanylate kinase